MDLLEPYGHGVLDKGEQPLAEADAQGHDLLHGQTFKVHDNNHSPHLSLFLHQGGYVYEVKKAEELVRGDF